MKYAIATIVLMSLFLMLTQQFRLSAELRTEPIACGGDFSSSQPCPFGSSCEVDEATPLEGGFCAPIFPGF